MGMSTHVIGFRPPDEKWRTMKTAWDGCKAAGVEPPREVSQFFGDCEPDAAGVEVDLGFALTAWQDDSRDGYELDLSLMPSHVTKIRFYNSW